MELARARAQTQTQTQEQTQAQQHRDERQQTAPHHNRRQFLQRVGTLGIAITAGAALLAACGGGDDDDDNDSADTATAAPTGADSTSAAPTRAATTEQPDTANAPAAANAASGRLRVVAGFLPATLDPVQDGYSLVQYGMAETLTRVTADAQVEPWLAEGFEALDAQTWRISLRPNATFWDGSPVSAEAVRTSIQHTWATNPAAAAYLDPATELTVVDAHTLEIHLPAALPVLVNNLASFHLQIAVPDAAELTCTGPYQVVEHVAEDRLHLRAFAGHWAGAPIAEIQLRLVRDANARVLALQSGEADLATEVPPEIASGLGGEIAVISGPSLRLHLMLLNHRRLPLQDAAVRSAMALAVDRDLLNQLTLAGLGTVASSIFPPGVGITTPDELVTDIAAAEHLLDTAGWLRHGDGVREREGTRLAFTLYTYARRPELVPIAISIQDQLRQVGFDLAVQTVEDIVAQLETEDVDAAMFSVNVLPTGDPFYALKMIAATDAAYNYLGYANPALQTLIDRLRSEADPDARADLALQAMELMRADASHLFLLAAPRITALRSGVISGYQHHPNDLYMIDSSLRSKG